VAGLRHHQPVATAAHWAAMDFNGYASKLSKEQATRHAAAQKKQQAATRERERAATKAALHEARAEQVGPRPGLCETRGVQRWGAEVWGCVHVRI
jgi:hypothetical protein